MVVVVALCATIASGFFVIACISVWKLSLSLETLARRWKLQRKIPLPDFIPCHWLLGHIPSLYKQDEASLLMGVNETNRSGSRDKGILRGCFTVYTIVNVFHPKYVGLFLKEPKTRELYRLLMPWLGEGLLVADGKKWARNRKLLTPAFHYDILKGYVAVHNRCLAVLLKKWDKAMQKGESVLLFNTVSLMSLDIVMQTVMSFESNCQEARVQSPYVKACSELVYLVSDRVMNPIYLIEGLYWLTPHSWRTRRACKLVHRHAEKIISDRRRLLDSHGDAVKEDQGYSTIKKRLDFLDILLMARDEEGRGMSDLEIRNEVDTFMFAGHDTTTSAMSWTLYCLAQHPQHQDMIREEVRSILKGREWLEYEDLKQLNYTSWCIKEAIRLHPPAFGIFRKTTEEIEAGDLTIPKGATIRIDIFTIHRNINVWENPNKYDPLRFQPENIDKKNPYDFIPFSAGNRNCIGQVFAMNEMKTVIGTIVNRFHLKLDRGHQVEMVPRVVLRAKNDIRVDLGPC